MDRRFVGTFRERQARQVLLPHAARTETARDGAFEMGSLLSRDWLDLEPAPRREVTVTVSQVALVAAPFRQRSRVARGTAVPSGGGDGRASARRTFAASGPLCRAPCNGKPHARAGKYSRRLDSGVAGAEFSGTPPWTPHTLARPRVHAGLDCDAGSRDWIERHRVYRYGSHALSGLPVGPAE